MAYKGNSILGIITARGGSKGLPKKNIRFLGNKPLIAWTIEESQKSKYIDKLILSSDCEEIISIAKNYNCEVPFIRPKELAEDDSRSEDVILHALANCSKFDYFVILQPTSPFRGYLDIDECIIKCLELNAKTCVSVVEAPLKPQLIFSTDHKHKLYPLLEGSNIARRQEMKQYYCINGAVYVGCSNSFIETKELVNKNTVCTIMPKERSLDIDDPNDFLLAEFIISKKGLKIES